MARVSTISEIATSKLVQADDESVPGQQTFRNQSNSNKNIFTTENPLTNELILDVIFGHLSIRNWRSARLVNKTWHSTLQPRWRNGMRFRLGHENDPSRIKTCTIKVLEQVHPANNPNDPFDFGQHPMRHIYARYNLNKIFMLLLPDQTRFWELFGHGLKSIKIVCVPIHLGTALKRLLFELTPCLEEFRYYQSVCDDKENLELNTVTEYTPPNKQQKNLKVWKVCTSSGKENYKRRFPISWIEVFSVFPNIQKLNPEIYTDGNRGTNDLLQLFEAIDIVRKANNNQVLNITKLSLCEYGIADVDVIKNRSLFSSLPISTLKLDVENLTKDKIVNFVQTFTSTLRYLKLQSQDSLKIHLPKDMFPQGLTKLCLCGPFISSLEFLRYTPNLEELQVENIPCILPPEVDLATVNPLVNMKTLSYTMKSSSVRQDKMDILAKMLPNVKSCESTVDVNGFEALCRGWVDLEHLDLKFRFESDDEDFFAENLIKLKCLRSLKLNWCSKVTDKSVYKAFLKMPSLTKVHLPEDAVFAITKKGFKALGGKLYRGNN